MAEVVKQKCVHRVRLGNGKTKQCFRYREVGDHCRYHHPDAVSNRRTAGVFRYSLGSSHG